jgi:hypothetical protein
MAGSVPAMPREDAVPIPEGLAALGPDVEAKLRRLVADAERRDDRELVEALDSAMKLVPRPLRGVARKVLLG